MVGSEVVEIVVDVGKPGGAFAWVHTENGGLATAPQRLPRTTRAEGDCPRVGDHWPHECLSCLRVFLADQLRHGPVSLGLEAPLLVPLPSPAGNGEVTLHPRPFEEADVDRGVQNRGWYHGPGATTFAQGLAELTYLLGELAGSLTTVTTDPNRDPTTSEEPARSLFVWEAFVTQITFDTPVEKLDLQLRDQLLVREDYERLPRFAQGHLAGSAKDFAAAALALRARLSGDRILYPDGDTAPADGLLNIVKHAAYATGVRFDGDASRIAVYRGRPRHQR